MYLRLSKRLKFFEEQNQEYHNSTTEVGQDKPTLLSGSGSLKRSMGMSMGLEINRLSPSVLAPVSAAQSPETKDCVFVFLSKHSKGGELISHKPFIFFQ